jgi:flagellar hook-basal body complex protein FliE
MKTKPILFILLLVLITACSHTNKLAEYDLRSKNFAFRNNLSSNAQQMTITIKSSNKDTTDLAETISSIFTDVVSESKKKELINAVDTY